MAKSQIIDSDKNIIYNLKALTNIMIIFNKR